MIFTLINGNAIQVLMRGVESYAGGVLETYNNFFWPCLLYSETFFFNYLLLFS